MNSKSSPSPIQKALDLAKRRPFDQVKQASAENEYAKLREATDFVNNNNNEKFQHFKRLTKDTKKSAIKSNMVESSKNLYRILQRFGGEIGQEKVWSNYMLLLKCYEFRNENQTDQGARKTQNTPASNGGPGFAGRVSPLKQQHYQNTIPQDHPKPSDWKHIQESYEEKIQSYEEKIRKLNKENNVLMSETADQRNQLEEKEKRIEELTTRLSRIASQQLTQGNPNITDLSDGNRPTKLGERFSQVYDDQWSEAFEALKVKGKQEKEIVTELSDNVQDIYKFMQKSVGELMQKLASETSKVIMCPFQSTSLQPASRREVPLNGTEGIIRDLVKTQGHHALKSVQEKLGVTKRGEDKRIEKYNEILSELIWYMVIQDPPMVLKFIKNGEKMDKEGSFKPYSKTGSVAEVCVWPALLLHEGGPLIAKGFALPQ